MSNAQNTTSQYIYDNAFTVETVTAAVSAAMIRFETMSNAAVWEGATTWMNLAANSPWCPMANGMARIYNVELRRRGI